jgi:hypothetical protein
MVLTRSRSSPIAPQTVHSMLGNLTRTRLSSQSAV